MKINHLLAVLAAIAAASVCRAEVPAPAKAAVKALKITKGKPFSSGLAFMDGRFIAPPYTVERYGTVIRINGVQVTREIVPWEEFLKAQPGVRVIDPEQEPEAEPETTEPVPADEEEGDGEPQAADEEEGDCRPEPESDSDRRPPADDGESAADDDDEADAEDDDFDDFLDQLAGNGEAVAKKEDAPRKSAAEKKPAERKPAEKKVVERKPVPVKKPAPKKAKKAKVRYELDGEFEPNDSSRKYVEKINARRTEIDKALRGGGYMFFSSDRQPVTGDSGIADTILAKLPELQKENPGLSDFMNGARSAGLVFLPDGVLRDLHRNRVDYLKLVNLRKKK